MSMFIVQIKDVFSMINGRKSHTLRYSLMLCINCLSLMNLH